MYIKKRWVMKEGAGDTAEDSFRDESGLHPIVYRILKNRGINDIEDTYKFLDPDINDLHDPFLLPDMEEAVEKIRLAIDGNKKITVYGDYDADGVTSTSILYRCLKALEADVDYYIPNRMDEGYGLSIDAIDTIVTNNTGLIITVDCGISALDEVEYCRNIGLDIIITDHHECREVIPHTTVVNAKRHDSNYPFKDLSGAGVAFKLVQALSSVYNTIDPVEYMDLACIGTIADVVSLVDENRIIARYGLEKMRSTENVGIDALLRVSGINQDNIGASNVSFSIAPRINAAGRIASPETGVELFICDDVEKAEKLAVSLDEGNKKRQEIEEIILREADALIKEKQEKGDSLVYVLSSPGWHVGVVGIVASKLVEKYYRPVVMLSGEGDTYRGSARSISGFNIFEAFCKCSDLLLKYGGHELAAGLSVSSENLELFEEKLNSVAIDVLDPKFLVPCVTIDCEIKEKDITAELVEELANLEPFGMGNPQPLFAYKSVAIEDMKTVGSQDKHLKLKIKDNFNSFNAIAFNMGYNINGYSKNDYIDLVCSPEINVWNDREEVQLVVRDMRPSPFKRVEEEYYRSLKKVLESLSGPGEDNEFLPHGYIMDPKGEIEILDETLSSRGSLIVVNNLKSLEILLENNIYHEFVFESCESLNKNGHTVVINPDFCRLNLEGVSDVYILDNLVNYNYISNKLMVSGNTRWHICNIDVECDIEMVEHIKPSRKDLERLYLYIKKSSRGEGFKTSIKKISEMLGTNTLTAYYCVKILNEAGIISTGILNGTELMIKINETAKINIDNTASMKKFKYIISNLNKIKTYFHQN